MNFSRWGWNILIGIDQLANAMLGGDPDETISSRAAKARDRGERWGRWLCRLLDWLDPGHSERSREDDEGSKSSFKSARRDDDRA